MSRSLFARLDRKYGPRVDEATRRQFLQATLAASAGLLLSRQFAFGDVTAKKFNKSVLVVGAGFAGLACAYVSEVAAWRGNLFSNLVFICPRSEPTGLDSPRWFAPLRRLFLTTPPLGSGYYETMAGDAELTLFLRENFYSSRHVTDRKVARLRDNASRPGGIYPYASLVTGYLDKPLLASLPRVQTPILLIWGKHARPTPVEHSVRLLALARTCRLEVIQDAGAWPHDEQSAKVNRLIADYLKGRLPAAEQQGETRAGT
jgi:pimeloyl-ACP methyl ester carboxylesterase